jgi:hypothetical protein
VLTPRNNVPLPTPTINQNVFFKYPGMTVLNKCLQTFSPPEPAVTSKEKKGKANSSASKSVKRFQLPEEWIGDFIFRRKKESWVTERYLIFGDFCH